MERQILLVKGWEGFGDRLQVVTGCINYCLHHNASICVDWRDYMWGQDKTDFTDYFEIMGVQSVPLSTVIEKVKKGGVINPPAYTLEHIINPPSPLIHFPDFSSGICKSSLRQEGDIIVHNSKGDRVWHLNNLILNLRVSEKIAPIIIKNLSGLQMPYTAVHLRGSDRSKEVTLQTFMEEYEALPPHDKVRSYVISDTNSYINEWTQKYPNAIVLNRNAPVLKILSGLKGTHMMSTEILEFYGVSKHDLNINAITDFLVIAFSSNNIGNKESFFTKFAVFMRKASAVGVHLWLNWSPPVVSLKS
jgi:hypothetical protein